MNTNSDNSEKLGILFKYFGAALVMILGVMVVYHTILDRWLGTTVGARGEFGDQFGALNVLITGVAFFGVIISVAIQSRDLQSQTRALELQQKALLQQITEFQEQKEEMRRSAEAQEKLAEVMRLQLQAQILETAVNLKVAAAESGTSVNQWPQFKAQQWRNECAALGTMASTFGVSLHFPKEWSDS